MKAEDRGVDVTQNAIANPEVIERTRKEYPSPFDAFGPRVCGFGATNEIGYLAAKAGARGASEIGYD